MKLTRVLTNVIEHTFLCVELISFVIKYAKSSSMSWQKLVGVEGLSIICRNYKVLKFLYHQKSCSKPHDPSFTNIYDDLISAVTSVSYALINNSKNTEIINKENIKTLLDKSYIYNEEIPLPVYNHLNILKLLIDTYKNWNEANFNVLIDNNIKHGIINTDFTEDQKSYIEFLDYSHEVLKNAMTALILYSNDNTVTQTFLNIYQNYIIIFGSIGNSIARDSYLSDLCKLAIPNNLEKTLEMKDRNLLISKFLFNIVPCYQILESSSWVLLLEAMQKIYHLLLNSNVHSTKHSEEFDIDILIKNLENNIRKYYPNNFDLNKSVLKIRETPGVGKEIEKEDFNKKEENNENEEKSDVNRTSQISQISLNKNNIIGQDIISNNGSTPGFPKNEEVEIKKYAGLGFFSTIKSISIL